MNLVESHRPIREALVDWRFEAARAASGTDRFVAHTRGVCAVVRAFILCGLSDLASKDMIAWFLFLGAWWVLLAALALRDKLGLIYGADAPLTLRLLWIGIWVSNALPYAVAAASFTGRSRTRSPLPAFSVIAIAGSAAFVALFYGLPVRTPNIAAATSQLLAGMIFPILLLLIAEETRTSPARLRAVVMSVALFWLFTAGLRFVNASSTQRALGVTATPVFVLLSFSLIYCLVAAWNARQSKRALGTSHL